MSGVGAWPRGAGALVLRARACLAARPKWSRCSACVDVCPRSAVWIDGGPILSDACDGCGGCAPACPTGAIEFASAFGVRLPRVAGEGGAGDVSVACHAASGAGALVVPCVGSLDRVAVLDLAEAGVRSVRLAIGRCAGCDYEALLAHVPALVEAARVFGVRLTGSLPPGARAVEKIEVRARALRSMRARFRGPAADLVRATDPPPRRSRLVARQRTPGGRVLPGGRITVSRRCTGCTACAAMCPTQAITRVATATEVTLAHDPAACTACGICADACPTAAIRVESPAVATEPAVVAEVEVSTCRLCGLPHPPNSGQDGLCQPCLRRYGPHHRSRAEIRARVRSLPR